MTAAVDTNILLDVLIPNPRFLAASQRILNQGILKGALVICDIVYVELATQFPDQGSYKNFIFNTGLRLIPSGPDVLWEASRAWRKYHDNRGKTYAQASRRALADFIVGAHALVHAEALITRDQGFYRPYFKGLKIMEPA